VKWENANRISWYFNLIIFIVICEHKQNLQKRREIIRSHQKYEPELLNRSSLQSPNFLSSPQQMNVTVTLWCATTKVLDVLVLGLGVRWGWVANDMSRPLSPRGKTLRYPRRGSCVPPRADLDGCRKCCLLKGFDPKTDYAIMIHYTLTTFMILTQVIKVFSTRFQILTAVCVNIVCQSVTSWTSLDGYEYFGRIWFLFLHGWTLKLETAFYSIKLYTITSLKSKSNDKWSLNESLFQVTHTHTHTHAHTVVCVYAMKV
jgi:hypothetical protein